MQEGDILAVGGNSFRCIETPGHSPGHICLYDAGRKILLSADHILFDITPNITRWPEMENSLEQYFASLDKVYSLDVSLVLPGHRRIMTNHRKRIKALFEHHLKRLGEVLRALEGIEKTAWNVAPYLSWDIDSPSWGAFLPAQKWFAMGETIAHLNYLAVHRKIEVRECKDRILFSSKDRGKAFSLLKDKVKPKKLG